MAYNLSKHAVGGAKRPDSFSGLNPLFRSRLQQMYSVAPRDVRNGLNITSGFRSVAKQKKLWAKALKKYGSVSKARKWVAPPGKSQHGRGNAVDFSYKSSKSRQWAHANASRFGLHFPLSNENWHIELRGARNGRRHSTKNGKNSRDMSIVSNTSPVESSPESKSTLRPLENIAFSASPNMLGRTNQQVQDSNQLTTDTFSGRVLYQEATMLNANRNPYLQALRNPVKSFNPFLDNPFNRRT